MMFFEVATECSSWTHKPMGLEAALTSLGSRATDANVLPSHHNVLASGTCSAFKQRSELCVHLLLAALDTLLVIPKGSLLEAVKKLGLQS